METINFNNYILSPQSVCINASAYTLTNGPVGLSGDFWFTVLPAFLNNSLQQIIIQDNGNVYSRSYNGSAFTAWGSTTSSSTKGTAFIKGFSSAGVTAAPITITGGTLTYTNGLATSGTTGVALSLLRQYSVSVTLDVTSASTSGATFTITGANCTVSTQARSIGASASGYLNLSAIVTTSSTAAPVLTVVASAVTGTVAIVNDSTIQIAEL